MITARQAQLRFNDKAYVDAMVEVNNAIILACPGSKSVLISVETGKNNTPLMVKNALISVGFDVLLNHCGDGTTEISIKWN